MFFKTALCVIYDDRSQKVTASGGRWEQCQGMGLTEKGTRELSGMMKCSITCFRQWFHKWTQLLKQMKLNTSNSSMLIIF